MRLFVDVSPLRQSAQFRWLLGGHVVSNMARQILVVAIPYHVFVTTRSTAVIGLLGLVQALPLIFGSLLGGVAADAVDRRRLLLVSECAASVLALGLVASGGEGSSLWIVFAVAGLYAAAYGFESPVRPAIIPSLLGRGVVAAGFAVVATMQQIAQVVGPAVGGLLLAAFDIRVAYGVTACAHIVAGLSALALRPGVKSGVPFRGFGDAMVGGWRHLRRSRLLQQLMLVDFNAMLFGSPRALFPSFGLEVLGGDARTVGLLHAGPGVGALLGALTAGWLNGIGKHGRAIIASVVVYGLALVGFGLTRSVVGALFFLCVSGAADIISNVLRNSMLQLAVPDNLRGRMTSIKQALSGAGPPLGDVRAGMVADVTTPATAVVSGGLVAAAGALLIGRPGKELWTSDLRESEYSETAR